MMRCTLLALSCLMISCKDEASIQVAKITASTVTPTSKEGTGKVTLNCGGKAISVEGRCGGVVTMGTMIIAIQDKTVPQRVFTLSFNTDKFPESDMTYTIRKSNYMDEGKKVESDVYAGFSEITQDNQFDWSSDDASGTVTFTQSGSKMTCTLSNITLQPSIVYNKGDYNKPGIVSGKMEFYRN